MRVSKHQYIGAVDGLRGLAVIAVIFYHMKLSGILPGGFTGVDVFFVISGYVISKSLHNSTYKSFSEFVFDFYKRRIVRIVPLLVTVVTITIFLIVLFIPETWKSEMIQQVGLASFFWL